jgi:hypothetical protein
MKRKTLITLLIIVVPAALFTWDQLRERKGYSIATEKDPSFHKKVKRILHGTPLQLL